jgi:hypothetical protein
MGISLSYQPGLVPLGQAAYGAGLADYRRFLQSQQLQRDLQGNQIGAQKDLQSQSLQQDSWKTLVNDSRSAYTAELGAANSRYLGDLSAWDAQLRQGKGIEADAATQGRQLDWAREEQQNSITDVQYRQQQDQINARFLAEYQAWDAQARQAKELQQSAHTTNAGIADAQYRQKQALSVDRMNTMQSLAAQAQALDKELSAKRDLAAFGLQGDVYQRNQQAYLQQALGQQGHTQDLEMQQVRGQQARDLAGFDQLGRMDLQEQGFLQENLLGPYSGYADVMSARQAQMQDQSLQQKLSALDRAQQQGLIAGNDYQTARNELVQQRLGLQQQVGGSQQLRQSKLDEMTYKWKFPDGSEGTVFWDGQGKPEILENPGFRRQVDQLTTQYQENTKVLQQTIKGKQAFADAWLTAQLKAAADSRTPVNTDALQAEYARMTRLTPAEAAQLKALGGAQPGIVAQ